MWQACNNKASHRQINGSNEVTFGTLLGGTVLFLPVRWQKAKTINRHPTWLERLAKILYFGRVLWSCNNKTVKPKDLAEFIVANATLGGCVTIIGNGLDLGNGVSGRSLYDVMDGHSAMTLTFDGSDGTLSRSKTGHQALLPPITMANIHQGL